MIPPSGLAESQLAGLKELADCERLCPAVPDKEPKARSRLDYFPSPSPSPSPSPKKAGLGLGRGLGCVIIRPHAPLVCPLRLRRHHRHRPARPEALPGTEVAEHRPVSRRAHR